MADVKWIKLSVRLPDNRQLKQIRHLPGGDTIALLWVYLLCLAGEINDAGMIYFTPEIPYTEDMLAAQFDMDVNTVRLGLETFSRFGMVEVVDNILCLPTWEKWQAGDKLSEIREQTRLRVAKHREKQRLLAGNVTGNVTVTQGNATEQEPEREPEGRKNNNMGDSGAPESPPPSSKPSKASKPVKHKHGEFNNVLLTDEELDKLKAEYPDWQQKIENLSEYMERKGAKYKSHYLTIRNWARKDGVKRGANRGEDPGADDQGRYGLTL